MASLGADSAASTWPEPVTSAPQFEVIPLPGVEEEVAAHLPARTRVTVTSSPRQGQTATVDLAVSLAERGFTAVPHLAARSIGSAQELARILERLTQADVGELFVIAGDPEQPAGDFSGSLDLLAAIAELDGAFTIGVGGHPEGHPFLRQDEAVEELARKSEHASYLVTQMCFEAAPLLSWVTRLREHGIRLPVRPGIAGPVGLGRLVKIGSRVGVGTSLRMLTSQGSGIRRLVTPGTWTPDALLEDLADAFDDPAYGLEGLHVYTFNALEQTARWWNGFSSVQ